jgi:hypothetical protein
MRNFRVRSREAGAVAVRCCSAAKLKLIIRMLRGGEFLEPNPTSWSHWKKWH